MSLTAVAAAPSVPETSPLMEKTTAVVLSDGRQAIGVFAGLDSDGNVLLIKAVVKKLFKSPVDGEERTITRYVTTFMIPFANIVDFYQCELDFDFPGQNTN
jgi:hypothetical protein